jgi:hypothetical protein
MNLTFGFRDARLRAPLLVALFLPLASCHTDDLLNSPSEPTAADGDNTGAVGTDGPSMAMSYAGGIPFGTFKLPTSEFGTRYNGAMRNIDPSQLVKELGAIKARGGKVVLMFAGPEWNYKDGDGHFSLTKWKARVDRFKNVGFGSYIKDGTVIGHYLIDEPNDPHNWGGRPVSPATLEEMAKYSKMRWPGMVTVVRTYPDYLTKYSGSYHYLDAAWAQYVIFRWPNVKDFISSNVAKAKQKGLGLVVGLNIIKGGSKRGEPMTASQVRSYGSALLDNSYPCAFISWQYRDWYMSSSAVKDAMSTLRRQAQSRAFKTCRGS